MSVESAASAILQRGVQLDNKKRFTESLICYQEGMQLLVDMMKVELDMIKKNYLRTKIEGYMKRAELIKKHIGDQKDAGIFHEQLQIESNSTGHSYKSLFGRFLDEDVISVHVEDPYIRSFHQCQNFLRLCELLVKSCDNLKKVSLVTSYETNNGRNDKSAEQTEWFRQLAIDLKRRNIEFHVEFSPTLHDRQIQFPKKENLKTMWRLSSGKSEQTSVRNLRICSEHFKETDFIINKQGTRVLRVGVIPSVSLSPVTERIIKLSDNFSEKSYVCLSLADETINNTYGWMNPQEDSDFSLVSCAPALHSTHVECEPEPMTMCLTEIEAVAAAAQSCVLVSCMVPTTIPESFIQEPQPVFMEEPLIISKTTQKNKPIEVNYKKMENLLLESKLSSGWIIKLGRGLDIYKPPENKFTLGMYDFDFRPCHETQLDIFHSKDVKTITS